MRRLGLLSLLVVAAFAAAGCDEGDPSTPTSPTPAPTVTETFAGSLPTNGATTHQFTVAAAGTVTATLKSLAPEGAPAIGVSLGNWNGTVCQIVLAKDDAVQGAVVTGNMSGSGTLCLRVYDAAGTVVGTVTYSVDIVHP
jgi:hypothetical protein